MSAVLYLTLYYELFRKLLDISIKINFRKNRKLTKSIKQ